MIGINACVQLPVGSTEAVSIGGIRKSQPASPSPALRACVRTGLVTEEFLNSASGYGAPVVVEFQAGGLRREALMNIAKRGNDHQARGQGAPAICLCLAP